MDYEIVTEIPKTHSSKFSTALEEIKAQFHENPEAILKLPLDKSLISVIRKHGIKATTRKGDMYLQKQEGK